MVKHRTAELEGALLDAAVALAEGMEFELAADILWIDGAGGAFRPSQDWSHGGPIIERERIELGEGGGSKWWAEILDADWGTRVAGHGGGTALIAAMRAYVASKLGDEVELPWRHW